MRKIAIIQARMNSSRLPGKVLMKLAGVSVLGHIQNTMITARVKGIIDDYVIATTVNPLDDAILDWCGKYRVKCSRGSEDDVLGRVYYAAKSMKADVIVDITADCPLIDWRQIRSVMSMYGDGTSLNEFQSYLYASNCYKRCWPDGFDIQVYSIEALKKANDKIINGKHRSHAGWNIPKYLNVGTANYMASGRYFHPDWGLCLDTPEDYELLKILFERRINERSAEGIIDYLLENPELLEINRSVVRKVPGE